MRRTFQGRAWCIMRSHVVVEDGNEIPYQCGSSESGGQSAIDKNRRFGFLPGSWKRNSNIGMLRFARPVDHTTHYRHFKLLDPLIGFLPDRHLGPQITLNLIGHLLEKVAGGSPATR